MSNVVPLRDRLYPELDRERQPPTGDGGSGGVPPGGKGDDVSMERLAKLEGAFDSYQKALAVFTALIAFLGAVMLGGFALLSSQINRVDSRIDRLDAKVDSIPQRLTEEFRAMRTEMAAQTSAIANSVTATRATPAQVILVPAPGPSVQPERAPER